MKLIFRGVRGSIPSPGPKTVRYGGNTTCLEVRSDDNDLIILDAGTGIFPLSQTLFPELPLTVHLFITHTHWDHIQGLPFFIPLFIPGNTLRIHGAADPITQREVSEVLSRQMEYAYFPIREAELKARLEYVSLQECEAIQAGSAVVTNIMMNHPVINFGYKVTCNGKTLFFTGDHEWPYNIYEPGDDYYHEYEGLIAQKRQSIVEFIRGVDVLVVDSAYTEKEYPAKKGWGHGTFDTTILFAREAGVKHLFFTHHEPTRGDDALEKVFQEALDRHPRQPGDPEYHLAMEGVPFEW
ncbi:MAG: MBL fold metallo-hydrolase [Magnetococcales bacterium]|nr:MBL fold metallo-hydrolase [Magnetococcales bacterium]